MNQSTAVAPTSWLHKDSPSRKLLGGAIGNMGEQFDYSIYAFTAPIIALNFFPSSNPVAALLNTFVVYALSFVARPFGGVMFGYIGDRFGRFAILTWTVVLMGVGTMLIGLLPSYSSVGVLAPILLVVCRLLQGLSLGGETTGVESYIAESAPDGKRASWTSLVMSFAYIPVALVACFILGLRTVMGDAAFEAWGWRIPFLLGGVVAFAGYLLRRNLDDPDEYLEAKAEADQLALVPKSGESVAHALGQSFKTRKSMLLVILLLCSPSVAAYLLTGYMYTYLVKEGHNGHRRTAFERRRCGRPGDSSAVHGSTLRSFRTQTHVRGRRCLAVHQCVSGISLGRFGKPRRRPHWTVLPRLRCRRLYISDVRRFDRTIPHSGAVPKSRNFLQCGSCHFRRNDAAGRRSPDLSHRKFAGTSLLRYGDHRRLRHCRNRARARNEGRESTRVDLLKSAMVMILYMGMSHGRDLATNVSLLRTT